MTTVEKLARDLEEFARGKEFVGWDEAALVFLKALLEPSELMVLAMAEADHVGVGYGDLFTAAIDHAIQEHEG